jgi:hypothetical protein
MIAGLFSPSPRPGLAEVAPYELRRLLNTIFCHGVENIEVLSLATISLAPEADVPLNNGSDSRGATGGPFHSLLVPLLILYYELHPS